MDKATTNFTDYSHTELQRHYSRNQINPLQLKIFVLLEYCNNVLLLRLTLQKYVLLQHKSKSLMKSQHINLKKGFFFS